MIPASIRQIFDKPYESPPFIERFGVIEESPFGDIVLKYFVVNGVSKTGKMTTFEARKLVLQAVIARLQEELDSMGDEE